MTHDERVTNALDAFETLIAPAGWVSIEDASETDDGDVIVTVRLNVLRAERDTRIFTALDALTPDLPDPVTEAVRTAKIHRYPCD